MQTLKEKYFDKLLGLLQRVVEIDKTHKKDSEYFSIYHYVIWTENEISYSFSQKLDANEKFSVFEMKLIFKPKNAFELYSRVQDLNTGGDTIHEYKMNIIDAEEHLSGSVEWIEHKVSRYERELLSNFKP